jgi:hypothetical protein
MMQDIYSTSGYKIWPPFIASPGSSTCVVATWTITKTVSSTQHRISVNIFRFKEPGHTQHTYVMRKSNFMALPPVMGKAIWSEASPDNDLGCDLNGGAICISYETVRGYMVTVEVEIRGGEKG